MAYIARIKKLNLSTKEKFGSGKSIRSLFHRSENESEVPVPAGVPTKPYTLVLTELNRVLISKSVGIHMQSFSSVDFLANQNYAQRQESILASPTKVTFEFRPGLKEFLSKITQYYNVIVYSSLDEQTLELEAELIEDESSFFTFLLDK